MTVPSDPFRLVVLGDSTAFFNDRGPALPDDPALYPNIAGRLLERELGRRVDVTIVAQAGSDSRRTWYAVTKDPHVQFDVVAPADAVVVGIGSFDHAPMGTPSWLEALVPYLRPAGLRRRVRLALRALHPWVIRAHGGRLCRTPAREFERLYDAILFQVRSLTQGAPGVALGATDHRSRFYAHTHPRRLERERLQFAVARRHGFPTVPVWPLVEPHSGDLNRDGIHWPAPAHEAVARAAVAALLPQIRGEAPRPEAPPITAPGPPGPRT